jgi:CheY-like chemotaxis protein
MADVGEGSKKVNVNVEMEVRPFRAEQIMRSGISLFWRQEMSNFVALVVEDDLIQREFTAELLRDEGLEVVECSTAEAAELVVVATGTELLALVTDNCLAGEMTGVQLAEYAKRRFPHINVVVVSGQDPAYIPDNTTFLLKPYKPTELLDAVLH